MSAVGDGTLGLVVWPTYIGLCSGEPTPGVQGRWEPISVEYQRGQIDWAPENGTVIGRAFIRVPKGKYTHFLYFRHPESLEIVGSRQCPHPIVFDGPNNVVEAYPITNADLELMKPFNAP